MLLLLPEAEIMASETKGPMTADVLPIFTATSACVVRNNGAGYYHREQRKKEEPAQGITVDHLH